MTMLQALWAGASGMVAQNQVIAALADDVANLNTAAFKSTTVSLTNTSVQPQYPAGAVAPPAPPDVLIGTGTAPAAVVRDWSQGSIQTTGQPLDLAITGNGFFTVGLPGGQKGYTRAGIFTVDGDGTIVDRFGDPVLTTVGTTLTVPVGSGPVSVSQQGVVTVTSAGSSTPTTLGQLALAWPANPGGMGPGPNATWQPGPNAGTMLAGTPGSKGLGTVMQGAIEDSNASLASTMVSLIVAREAYQFNARTVQTTNQMWSVLNQIRA
jgi:flagellar basal-body rod protein FlgG